MVAVDQSALTILLLISVLLPLLKHTATPQSLLAANSADNSAIFYYSGTYCSAVFYAATCYATQLAWCRGNPLIVYSRYTIKLSDCYFVTLTDTSAPTCSWVHPSFVVQQLGFSLDGVLVVTVSLLNIVYAGLEVLHCQGAFNLGKEMETPTSSRTFNISTGAPTDHGTY